MRARWAPIAGGAAVLALVAGAAAWRAGVFDDDPPAVPSCAELTSHLTASIGGAWSTRSADPVPRLAPASASCRFGFVSADKRFSGEVTVYLRGDTNVEALRDDVDVYPCYGAREQGPAGNGYLATRRCVEIIGDTVRAGMSAATSLRFAHVLAAISGPTAVTADFASDLARRATEGSLSLSSAT
jgi:hypothetical protein